MKYRVEFTEAALRSLRNLPKPVQRRIVSKAESLAENPRPHGSEKLETRLSLYRIRTGDYRIIYRIDDAEILVIVVKIGDRKDVYRWLSGL